MSELEFEARTIITKEEYEKLLGFYVQEYPSHKNTDQKNIYLDTKDQQIEKLGNVLRIRSYKDKRPTKLTYKFKSPSNKCDEEVTQVIDITTELKLLQGGLLPNGEVKNALAASNISTDKFYFFGEIKTHRFEIFEGKNTIVIDQNEYHGVVDYNLEVESDSRDNAEAILKNICSSFGIKIEREPSTKSQRTIRRYLQVNKK